MRILVLGGDGMLGHQLLKVLRPDHATRATLHRPLAAYADHMLFGSGTAYPDVDARDLPRLREVFDDFLPEAVVNCIGLIKQRQASDDVIASIEINALFPHRLAELCHELSARLIHISTDCVFSGRKGMYGEADPPDAEDTYGRTKLLGEVTGSRCLTLRTSMIGRELARSYGLLEWFLAQRGTVQGYRRAIFSGLTTAEISRVIKMILERQPGAEGLYHLSGDRIDKFSLLQLAKDRFGVAVDIVADNTMEIDRSLDSSRFRDEFDYCPPSWPEMIASLAGENSREFAR